MGFNTFYGLSTHVKPIYNFVSQATLLNDFLAKPTIVTHYTNKVCETFLGP